MKNDMNNKEFVGESEAKAIVRGFMRQYQYTAENLERVLIMMWRNVRTPTTIAKREELLKKKFARYGKGIICKPIHASFSPHVLFLAASDINDKEFICPSVTDRKKEHKVAQKHKRYLFKLKNQIFHTFIVRVPNRCALELMMFLASADNKADVSKWIGVTTITKHCLERIIERLNLKSVDQALDEILSGLQNMYCSNQELMLRVGENTSFYRHIPTQNGALLMSTYGDNEGNFRSDLITWIHKRQFFKEQEVTNWEFNLIQHINYELLNPNRESIIEEYKMRRKRLQAGLPKSAKVYIEINGESYSLDEVIQYLEKGEYLDFMIDFEKFRH